VCGERRGNGDLAVRAEHQFHIGVVVDDFEAALADLSSTFGHEWCEELGKPIQVWLSAGAALLKPGPPAEPEPFVRNRTERDGLGRSATIWRRIRHFPNRLDHHENKILYS
jgi:hypothetical protein